MHVTSTVRSLATFVFVLLAGAVGFTQPAQAVTPAAAAEDKEVALFGQSLADAYNKRDEALTSSLLDMNGLGLRVGRVMYPDDAADQKSFAGGFSRNGGKSLVQTQFKLLEAAHGSVKFMRVPAPQRVLLRVDLRDQGFDYLEFVLERDPSGHYRAVDWYQLSRGELVSVTVGAVTRLMIDPSPDLLRSLFGLKKMDPELIERLKIIGTFQRTGKYAEALAAYEQLPPAIGSSRIMLMARAGAASMAHNDEAYKKTLAELARLFGDDPAASFMLLDHYIYAKQTDKAVQAVANIERRVGVDGITRLLKANAYLLSGNFPQTLVFAQESLQLEPTRSEPYFALAAAHIGLKQFPDAVTAFSKLASDFGYTFDRQKFFEDASYAEFVKSAAFKKWLP